MAHLVAGGGASFHAPVFEAQAGGELSAAQPAAEGAMEEGHGKEVQQQLPAAEGEAKQTESEEEEGEEEQHHAEPSKQVEQMVHPHQGMAFPGLWTFPFAGMNGQPPPQAYPYAMQHPYSGYWPFPHGMHPGTLGSPIGKNDKTGKRRKKKKPAMEVRPPLHFSFTFPPLDNQPLCLPWAQQTLCNVPRTEACVRADETPAVPAAPVHSTSVSASPCQLLLKRCVRARPAPQTEGPQASRAEILPHNRICSTGPLSAPS